MSSLTNFLESVVGFNVSLSEVCRESVRSPMVTKVGELIGTALQIEICCHLQKKSWSPLGVNQEIYQEFVRSLIETKFGELF